MYDCNYLDEWSTEECPYDYKCLDKHHDYKCPEVDEYMYECKYLNGWSIEECPYDYECLDKQCDYKCPTGDENNERLGD